MGNPDPRVWHLEICSSESAEFCSLSAPNICSKYNRSKETKSGFLSITFIVFAIDLITTTWLLKKQGYARTEEWFAKMDLGTTAS